MMRALPDIFAKLGFKDDFVVRTRLERKKAILNDDWIYENTADEFLYPISDIAGQTAGGGSEPPCDPPRYSNVDDTQGAPDDDATYNKTCSGDSLPQVDHFGKTASGLAVDEIITNIRALLRTQFASTDLFMGLFIGSTDYFSAGETPSSPTPYRDITYDWPNNPATGEIFTKAIIDALSIKYKINNAAIRITQFYLTVTYKGQSIGDITDDGGRLRFERLIAGAEDHVIKHSFTSQDWSEFDTIRFRIQKVVYAGTNPLTFEIYATSKISVTVSPDYCFFDSTTEETLCIIPLSDFSGADLTDVEGIGFTMDGDDGDYDFYVDDFEVVKLDSENNVEYYDGLDTNIQGYSDIGNGIETRTGAGRVTEKSGTFYLPKDTEITLFDYIIYNDETYAVIGINDDYPTHLVVDALFREVWN